MIIDYLVKVAKTLDNQNVKYAIVGGCAKMFYFENNITHDIDILIETSPENLINFEKYINVNLKIPFDGIQFANATILRVKSKPHRIDFLSTLDGVPMNDVFLESQSIKIKETYINFISKHHLIINLKTVNQLIYGLS